MRGGPIWIRGVEPGKLAIVPRPRGGDWLPDEVRSWTRSGLDMVVSLLTPEEERELDLADEAAQSRALGVEFRTFPIPDRGVPSSREDARQAFQSLMELLAAGKSIGIHCRQGIGRSPLVVASLLALAGIPPDQALERIGVAVGRTVPETAEQRRWVEELATFEVAAGRVSEGSPGFKSPKARSGGKASVDAVWRRLKNLEGEEFRTKTGLPFTYEISSDTFRPSRTEYKVSKADFERALALVPFDGPGTINSIVRGPAYVWAVLHDQRVRMGDW